MRVESTIEMDFHARPVRIDLDPARRAEMMEKTARRTVPQIYIGDTYVGGCDELFALDHAAKLLPLLSGEAV